jgi:hypothetical protein
MNKIVVVGIDPGINGGISCLENGEISHSIPMPIVKTNLGKRVDPIKLASELNRLNPDRVIIEEPQVRPGENIKNHLTIGINFGIIYAIVLGLHYNLTIVPAVTWTRAVHSLITGSKEWETHPPKMKSLKTFRKLYPESKVTHDGIIDATLIAFFWLWKEGHLARIKKSTNSV